MLYSIKWHVLNQHRLQVSALFIKLQVLLHLILEEQLNPDTMRFWPQDDASSLIPIVGGIIIFLDMSWTSLCSIIDNSQISEDGWHLQVTLITCPLSKDKPANKSVPPGVTKPCILWHWTALTYWLAGSSTGVAVGLGSNSSADPSAELSAREPTSQRSTQQSMGVVGLYSLSSKTSYRKISWSLEAARFVFRLFQSLWNLTTISTAMLRDFARFGGKTSYRSVNRGPGYSIVWPL